MAPRSTPGRVAISSALLVVACRGSSRDQRAAPVESAEAAPVASSVSAGAPAPGPRAHLPGESPFNYPIVSTTARAGDYVLAPSKTFVDEAFARGGDKQTFIFYGGWMREPGPSESKVESLTRMKAMIPNALIVPIRRGEHVEPGNVVLTSWASGSGLQRAIVVSGGTPESPTVRYLDMDLDNPSGWGRKEDTLPPSTFQRLDKPGELGTTLACTEGSRRLRFILTHATGNAPGDKLLVLGHGGRMRVVTRGECKELPIVPPVKRGDLAVVPVAGAFVEGQVTKVDPVIGRVWVEYEFAGRKDKESVGFTNVAAKL
jgi:hypothetical protein